MTRSDDLQIGTYIAITGYSDAVMEALESRLNEDQYGGGLGFFSMSPPPRQKRIQFSGSPLKIIRIARPFCCIEHPNGKREALDLREVFVQRVDPEYAKAMLGVVPAKRKRKKTAKQLIDEGCCPKCGQHSLIQQIVAGKSEGWKKMCRNADCNWRDDGGDGPMGVVWVTK